MPAMWRKYVNVNPFRYPKTKNLSKGDGRKAALFFYGKGSGNVFFIDFILWYTVLGRNREGSRGDQAFPGLDQDLFSEKEVC